MKCGQIVRNGRFHQPARFDVFGIARLAAGSVHPLVECNRMLFDARVGDAQGICSEERRELAARKRARVGRVADALDAVVHFRTARVFERENIDDAGAAAALEHARHLTDHSPGFRHVVQSIA